MSITYIYNSSTINLFTTEDLGSITANPTTEDYGSITAAHTQAETYSEVQYTADAYPFGTATIGGATVVKLIKIYRFVGAGGFQLSDLAQTFFIHAWTGSGSLFEIGGGLERIVAPYLGADPQTTTLFNVSGVAEESYTTLYNIEDATTLSTEDFGLVSVGGSSVDYGQINTYSTTQLNYGTVSDIFAVPYVGNISISGSATESFTESGYVGTGSYGGFSGSAEIAVPFRFEGSGSLFSIGGGIEQKTWIYPDTHHFVEYTPSYINNNSHLVYTNDASYQTGGTGTGSTGGFDIGEHILLGEQGSVRFKTETSRIQKLILYVIRGNDTNGGATPDNNLVVSITAGNSVYAVTPSDTSFDNVRAVEIPGSLITGIHLRITITNSGSGNYGIQSVGHYEVGPEFSAGLGFPASLIPAGGFTISGGTSSANDFRLQGPIYIEGGADSVRTFSHQSTLSRSFGGSSSSSLTRDYDLDNVDVFSTSDNGLISASTTNSDDQGSVLDTEAIQYGDNGVIRHTATTASASGTINTSGAAGAIFLLQVFETGSGSITLSGAGSTPFIPNFISTGLFGFTGTVGVYLIREFAGSGDISRFTGGEDNRNTRNYDENAVVTFSTSDSGLVSASTTTTQDNGLISLDAASIDNGQIFFEPTPFGGMTIAGGASNARPLRTFLYSGTTAQIQLSGAAPNKFNPGPWMGTGLFGFTGGVSVRIPRGYAGSGTFNLSDGFIPDEKKTSAYNISATDVFSTTDRGLVSQATGSTSDSGSVSSIATLASQDFGTIYHGNSTNNAFGFFNIGGAAVTANPRKQIYAAVGGGVLFNILGGEFKFLPNWIGSGNISFSGASTPNFALINYGVYNFTLQGGNQREVRAYHYNIDPSSWDRYYESEFGTISSNPQTPRDQLYPVGESPVSLPNTTHDFGSTTKLSIEKYYDFGNVSTTADTKSAAGLFRFASTTNTEFKPEFAQIGSGSFFVGGTGANSFFPTWNGSGTISTSGGRNTFTHVDSYSFSPHVIAQANLFSNGLAGEAKTQHYNISSVDTYSTEDFGNILASPLGYEDYNLVSDPNANVIENWGYLSTQGQTNNPFGLFRISGAAQTKKMLRVFITGSGSLFAIGGVAETFQLGYTSTGLFQIGGAANTPFAFKIVSTGTLFSSGIVGEAKTQHYNISSVAAWNTEDYGSLAQATSTIDQGQLTAVPTAGEVDYGSVLFGAPPSGEPFGLFRISGSTRYEYKPEFAQVGNAFIVASGTAITSFLPNWVGSGSINLSGGDGYNLSPNIISSGGLFTIGGAAERVTFDYNLSSTDVFGTEDWGLLSQTPTATEDFTSITTGNTEIYNYGTIFHGNQTNTAFGSAFLSGVAVTAGLRKPAYTGSGTLFAIGGAADAVVQTDDTTGLFRITGAADTPFSFRHVSTGVLFANGILGEAVTKSYNLSSSLTFTSEDYGLVTANATSTEDYGSLTATPTGGEVDYGSVLFGTPPSGSPFGLFRITGTTVYSYKPEFAQIGNALITLTGAAPTSFLPNWVGSGSIVLSGGDKFAFAPHIIGSGGLFTIGGVAEAVTKSYNLSSADTFSTENWGLLSQTATSTENFGSVTTGNTEIYNYGTIFHGNQTNNPFGSLDLSGAAVTAGLRKPAYTGSGSLFTTSGAAVSKSTNVQENTVLFNFTGSTVPNLSLLHISTGSLFTIGGGAEKVTFHYNLSSALTFSTENYGSVSANATTTEDYGQLTAVPTGGEIDYGTVLYGPNNGDPFGTITLSSTTEYVYKPEFGQIGNALIVVTGNSTSAFIPNWNGSGSVNLSGGDGYNLSPHIISTGGFFASGISGEAKTQHYNISSVDVYSTEDYGSVPATAGTTEDQGFIYADSTQHVNYGTLFTVGQSNQPFGLFQLGGAAVTAGLRKPSYTGSGSLFTAGGEANAKASAVQENTVLFRFAGSTVPNFSFRQPANAFLSIDVQSEERRTHHYNRDTVITFVTVDQGLVTSTATGEDYGQIGSIETSSEDYGTILYTQTVRAASGTITISGTVVDDFIAENAHTGSGTFTFTSTTETAFIPNWVGTGLFNFSGGDKFAFAPHIIGSGGLFKNGIAGEAVAKAYNLSSSIVFSTEDYGSITATATTTEDYGLVTTPGGAPLDLGNLIITQSTDPFGLFQISGSADTFFQPFRGGESTVLFQFSGTREFEQFIPNWNGSGGITVFGTAGQVAYRNFPYTATGSLFTNGIVGEAVTKHYNISSVLPYSTEDHGSVASTATTTEDYGQIANPATAELDYGYVYEYPGFGDPFGTITLSGAVNGTGRAIFIRAPYAAFGNFTILSNVLIPMEEAYARGYRGSGAVYLSIASAKKRRTQAFQGSGTLFAASGAAESKTTNKPESTVLFAVGGSAETQRARDFIGSGSLFALSGAAEAAAVVPEATGLFTISGAAETPRARDFIGSGSLFSVGGAAEAVAVAPEATGLFTISGSGDPPIITLKFFGGGTVTISGTAGESFTQSGYDGSGSLFALNGAAEAFGADPLENITLHVISGTAEPILRTRAFQGSGTITVSGVADERRLVHYTGTGTITIDGLATAEESYAPAAEIGSGSLFTVSGAAESFTANPDENTVLYDITGTAEPIIRTQAFQGSGTINISGQLGLKVVLHFYGSGGIVLSGTVGESFTPATEVGSGSITLSGTKDESFTKGNYTGSGSIVLSGAAVEKQLDNYTGSGTATISGSAVERQADDYVGSGSLFTASGAAESKTTNKPESTILFAISGAASESFGKGNYDGSGITTFSGAGIEKQTDDYVGTGSASLSGTADTDRTRAFAGSGSLFAIGGAAEAVAVVEPGTGLFAISGVVAESTTKGNYDGSGTITLSGAATESYIKAPYVGSGTITISGQFSDIKLTYAQEGSGSITLSGIAHTTRARDFVGSGSLFAIGGAAESTTKDLPEFTGLFTFSGTKTEKSVAREVSPGGTITISGQATNVRFNRGWTGSGLITISGAAETPRARDFVGSGSLFSVGGGAESITTNPPENIVLYTFSGTAGDQKLTFREVFSGTITLSGSATARLVVNNVGSGTTTLSGSSPESKSSDIVGVTTPGYIFFSAFGGTRFSRTFPGQTEGGTITISGVAFTPRTHQFTGSGSLFAVGGASESKSTNIPENTVLFVATGTAATPRTRDFVGSGGATLSGEASVVRTRGYAGSGTATISGTADTDRTRAFSGTGTLFAASGAAEAKTSNKPESTVLFVFTGDTKTPRARVHIGSGSLFGFNGAAEAVAVAPETTGLFRISGDAGLKFIVHYTGSGQITISGNGAEAFVRPTYIGSGSFGGFSGAAEESASVAEEFTGTQTVSGTAEPVIRSRAYRGTGSLFAVGGASETKTTNKPESTVLFDFTGEANTNFIESGYEGQGTVTVSGIADTELRVFQPPHTFITII